jgi:hypothetical protein
MVLLPLMLQERGATVIVLLQVAEPVSLVTVEEKVPAVFTEMQRVVSPVLHK